MSVIFYDLAGADPKRRFSPYCWRIRMALAHKQLEVDDRPWCFTEKDAIGFSGQGLVPVIVDRGRSVHDSWEIARHLETAYPDRPSLFGGAEAPIRLIASWTERVVQPQIGRMIIADIVAVLDEKDKVYFRESREKRFGMTLETAQADRDERLPAFRQSLEPVRTVLASYPWLGGAKPNYADYAVFGAFQWARCTSPYKLLAEDDPIFAWHKRARDLFDGLAEKAPAFG
ncbi:MAG: glutathione S-transferase family protein [Alphaproteobacteria bacterium]|nr:glutathione S-transferase family protein [Alphaproteobacteria bacterium]